MIYSTKPNKIVHDHEQSSDDAKNIVEQLTKPGDTVFDSFMGSGSTGIAALSLKRTFTGIEMDKERFEIARVRISNEHVQNTIVHPSINENKNTVSSCLHTKKSPA